MKGKAKSGRTSKAGLSGSGCDPVKKVSENTANEKYLYLPSGKAASGEEISAGSQLLSEEEDFLRKDSNVADAKLEKKVRELEKEIIDREKVEDDLSRQSTNLMTLNRIMMDVASTLELRDVLERTVKSAVELAGADGGSVALYDEALQVMTYPYHYNMPERLMSVVARKGQGLAEHVMKTGESVVIEDYPAHPRALKEYVDAGLKVLLAVPIVTKDRSFGTLGIFGLTPDKRFTAQQVVLVQGIGRQAAIAIENAKFFEETRLLSENLRKMNAYNRKLIEASLDPLVTIGPDGKITDVNLATEKVTGCSRDELIGTDFSDYFTEPEKARAGYKQVFTEGFVRDYPLEIRHRDGNITYVLYNASVYRDESGAVIGVFAAARDITERKEAEDSLYRINRTLKMLVECNESLIHSTDELDLMKKLCNTIVTVGGYRLAWVGYAENDAGKTVTPVAQSGYEEGYLETLNVTWADTDRGLGPTGTAIRTGKYVVVKNILTDPVYEPWRSEAVKRGYASSIAIPLVTGSLTIGSLNIYAVEPYAFDTDEIHLLEELADDLSFGIMTMRIQREKNKAEEALIAEQQELRQRIEELERFRKSTTQREFRIKELNDRVRELESELRAQKALPQSGGVS